NNNSNSTDPTIQLLDHPHIIYPTMIPQSQGDGDLNTHTSVHTSISAKRDLLKRRSFSTTARIAPSTSGSCSSTEWDSDVDRATMRGLDSSSSEEELDDDDNATSEEQSESDSDRWRIPTSQHLPVSAKRRKVSIDEDYEQLTLRPDEIETRPTNMASSNRQRHARPTSSTVTSPSPNIYHRHSQSITMTATATSRKRRSFIAESSSSPIPAFSFSDLLPNERSLLPSSASLTSQTANRLDTSSLSLLCETSALVSKGTISTLDNDNASLQALLEPSSSSLSSSHLPSLSSMSTCCFSLPPSAKSPFLAADRAQFNAQELLESISSLTSASSSSPSLLTTSSPTITSIPAGIRSVQTSRRQYNQPPLLGPCRKRSYEDAIELMRPLGNDPSIEHAGWLGSIKRRKIHHFPTRWTSSLSPSPYIKLLAMRDFWDVMKWRLDLSWLNLWTASGSRTTTFEEVDDSSETVDDSNEEIGRNYSLMESKVENEKVKSAMLNTSTWSLDSENILTKEEQQLESAGKALSSQPIFSIAHLKPSKGNEDCGKFPSEKATIDPQWPMCAMSHRKTRKVIQYPSVALFLRGLWEEEEHCRRQKQMIPEGVHKPLRSKVLNRRPLPRSAVAKTHFTSSDKSQSRDTETATTSGSQSSSTQNDFTSLSTTDPSTSNKESKDESNIQDTSYNNEGDEDMLLRKKYGPTTAIRSNILSEGYDLNEYKPWKDATITPHQGCIQTLRRMRCTMLEPWPVEESRAKDECSRILHVMREQLNVVINLQIHLRSMIKTAPQHMSFLLSVRHPGQISIELLNALYGPQFMQSNAFRSIEQLLWGKNHSWKADGSLPSLSSSSLLQYRPPSQLTRYSAPLSASASLQDYRSSSSSQQRNQQCQQYSEHSYHHSYHNIENEHDSMFDNSELSHQGHFRYQEHHYQDHDDHDEEYVHQRQYSQHQHDEYDHNRSKYHSYSQDSYHDHHHDHQCSSSYQHYRDNGNVQALSHRYTPSGMEEVGECNFEDEFDHPPYQDSLLEIDSIIANGCSENESRSRKWKDAVLLSMDGGYESDEEVSEGEIEALEVSSSPSPVVYSQP
ncbi:hypothetical protein FBU30_000272, partial [Linnemannia zychae]